jgi:2-polyprenyl-3-methyl-5-hydroxy-6-metoxy-1,4-benzoquinol methylase
LEQLLGQALPWKPLLQLMLSFKNRSYQKELLDADNIPFDAIKQNMQELNTINTLLGGHAITVAGVRKILTQKNKISLSNSLVICEIGCGGGDNIMAIHKWAVKNNLQINFIGIDYKYECIEFAKNKYSTIPVQWMCKPYQKVDFAIKPDIIFSSLFCHHFSNEDLVQQLKWLKENSTVGFFINDLHRNKLAYFFIKWLTKLFSKSYLVKHDAPLSVARGFTKKEWLNTISAAAIGQCIVNWKWAFRHLIVYTK